VLNPVDDRAFATSARSAMRGGARSPDELRFVLSQRYPKVVIHRRELSNERVEIWYVYRDGRWTTSSAGTKEGR
jgi:hypothetical protein